MDLTIGIVAYNALDKLRDCLGSIAAQTGCGAVETVVVDNASTEPVAATVAAEYPWVELVASAENLGFTGGTNRAFQGAAGRLLLWLNPDTVLPEPDTLARLIACYEAHSSLAALGCRLVHLDGQEQLHSGRAPRVREALLDLAHLWHPRIAPLPESGEPLPVEFISGACLLTRAEVWRQVGGLDNDYFMYLEDVDWCRRAAALGPCAVTPEVTVVHAEGACWGSRLLERRERYWRSLVRYIRKHDGPLAAFALRLGLGLLTAPKLLVARGEKRQFLLAQWRLALKGQ